jgi:RNA polymerase sigma-70 factor (ECF subfamily)
MHGVSSSCGRDGDAGRVHARGVARHERGAGAGHHAITHEHRRGPACALTDFGPTSHAPSTVEAEGAFADLVRDHVPSMVRRARRLLGSEDLAWDAVQESLLSLWQATTRPAETRPWLLRTVVYRCLHIRRTLHRRWRHEERAGQVAAAVGTAHDPASELEQDAIRRTLRRAVGRLPVGQRQAFMLRELEGLDYREIAGQLRVPIGTVRSRLARARNALRQILDGVGQVG